MLLPVAIRLSGAAISLGCLIFSPTVLLAESEDGSAPTVSEQAILMDGINVTFGGKTFQIPPLRIDQRREVVTTGYVDRVAEEDSSRSAVSLLDPQGSPLGLDISHADYCIATDEGTVWVTRKGVVVARLNYAGQIAKRSADCSDIFRKLSATKSGKVSVEKWGHTVFAPLPHSAPFGTGAKTKNSSCSDLAKAPEFRLIPHRSIAVDPKIIRVGSLVYIPTLRGQKIELPDGQSFFHDGFLLAVDGGSRIRGLHIDYFLGPSAKDHVPTGVAADSKAPLSIYIVDDLEASSSLCALHATR